MLVLRWCSAMTIFALTCFNLFAQFKPSEVKVVGEMRNVMWKGQLHATINLDTIADKKNLYGLGPMEELTGEIIILDGRAFQATVSPGTTMDIKETFQIKAPFFGYAHIAQ